MPWSLISRMMLKICSTSKGERPIEGSSSSSKSGLDIRPRAIASICCSPPESVPPNWLRRSLKRGKRWKPFSISFWILALSFWVKAPISRFSITVRVAKIFRPSGTWTIPLRTICSDRVWVMSSPLKKHLAGARAEQARDGAQGGAFSSAIGADQGHNFALFQVKADAF